MDFSCLPLVGLLGKHLDKYISDRQLFLSGLMSIMNSWCYYCTCHDFNDISWWFTFKDVIIHFLSTVLHRSNPSCGLLKASLVLIGDLIAPFSPGLKVFTEFLHVGPRDDFIHITHNLAREYCFVHHKWKPPLVFDLSQCAVMSCTFATIVSRSTSTPAPIS